MKEDPTLGRLERNRRRMTSRWTADQNVISAGRANELIIATCSGGQVAEHIAILHNRTLGDGQDPPDPRSVQVVAEFPENEQAIHRPWLAEATGQGPDRQDGHHVILAVGTLTNMHVGEVASGRVARYLVAMHNDRLERLRAYNDSGRTPAADVKGPERTDWSAVLPPPLRSMLTGQRRLSGLPRTALGQLLRTMGAPPYAAEVVDIVEEEARRQATDIAARQPARISLAEHPDAMVRVLRDLGYQVTAPGQGAT